MTTAGSVPSPLSRCLAQWDRFWFAPVDPFTLCVMRILAGAIIFYTHLVWTLEFPSFFSADQLLSLEHNQIITGSVFAWSHFHWIESLSVLWIIHGFALVTMFLFFLGLWTRVTGLLTALLTISYANRAVGATFGLDQINALLAVYLAIAPSGACLSLDAWWKKRQGLAAGDQRQILANFVTRLIQIHLCIIYLFAGCGKLLGASWWNGEAIWGAMANAEYQTVDLTWLAAYPLLINLITHVTLAWEVSYVILVWPRWSRPIIIGMAIAVHLGIGVTMGMVEFGLIMVTANLVFVPPAAFRAAWHRLGGPPPNAVATTGQR